MRVNEDELTMARKSILYRMIKDTLSTLCASHGSRGSAAISMEIPHGRLLLKIYVSSKDNRDLGVQSLPDYLESVKDRTILSGGRFNVARSGDTIESVSSWNS
jgi:hypothetical protein